jgi:hypothetical protein
VITIDVEEKHNVALVAPKYRPGNYVEGLKEDTGNVAHQNRGVRGGAVGRGTALQTGKSRVSFPMDSLEFFCNLILRIVALGSTQPLTEMSTRNRSWR